MLYFFSDHITEELRALLRGKPKFYGSSEGIYCSQHISLPRSLQLHVALLPASLLFITVPFGPPEQPPALPRPHAGVTREITPAEARMAWGTLVRIQQLTTGAI